MLPFRIPLRDWIEAGVGYLSDEFADAFDGFSETVLMLVGVLSGSLEALPYWLLILALAALAFWLSGWRPALFTAFGLLLTVNIELWESFIDTLVLVLTAEVLVILIGLPLGILTAASKAAEAVFNPLLDFMQTMPAFVYLIPAVTFFGLGLVPGVVATVIFSLPPLIRLTSLGLRQVPVELIEASEAFGATRLQRLFKVQLPVATPSIMAGVNQSIMLGLSMVVIAAMIGADGLGVDVLRGINRLDIGLGFEAGLVVVIMAIMLDRITQGLGMGRRHRR